MKAHATSAESLSLGERTKSMDLALYHGICIPSPPVEVGRRHQQMPAVLNKLSQVLVRRAQSAPALQRWGCAPSCSPSAQAISVSVARCPACVQPCQPHLVAVPCAERHCAWTRIEIARRPPRPFFVAPDVLPTTGVNDPGGERRCGLHDVENGKQKSADGSTIGSGAASVS